MAEMQELRLCPIPRMAIYHSVRAAGSAGPGTCNLEE